MIGLARGTVQIAPYSNEWKEAYKQEENILKSLIGNYVLDIQHVGSTSIEGLASKPIIDIAVGVKTLKDVEKFKSILEDNGYHFRDNAGVEGRLMFAKGSEELRTHYIHIEVFGDKLWKNHIYFRDYLRLHKDLVDEYAELKKELGTKFGDDRGSYTSSKHDFIENTLKKAYEFFE